jgi:hypothetical protein
VRFGNYWLKRVTRLAGALFTLPQYRNAVRPQPWHGSCEHSAINERGHRAMKSNDKNSPFVNVLALVKGEEKYVFTYDDASRKALLGVFGSFAKNPDLSFSWNDAAALSRKVRANEGKLSINPRLRAQRTQ